MTPEFHCQLHGYRSGHQLLESSISLGKRDQDVVDRLSDISGPLRPSETFASYLTAYPVPSGEFFAVAITKQDLAAPRAGCVLTRTLLIPSLAWETSKSPADLLLSFDSKTGFDESLLVSSIAPVKAPFLDHLCEAMFLEKREPIAVFGAKNGIEIAVRLLTAAWPGMRRSFALCTFALAPRALPGRSFDLQFAPLHARPRFSDWTGRRIDGNVSSPPRHRWTRLIAERVFESEHPALIDEVTQVALGLGSDESEVELRISLLWNELLARSRESPEAILGCVDIANSRGVLPRVWKSILPAVDRSIRQFGVRDDALGAWSFATSLLGKFEDSEIDPELVRSLQPLLSGVLAQDWRLGLKFLTSSLAERDEVRPLAAALAGTLLELQPDSLSLELSQLDSIALSRGLRVVPELVLLGFERADDGSAANLAAEIEAALRSDPPELSRKATDRFILASAMQGQSGLLRELVARENNKGFEKVAAELWMDSRTHTDQVGQVLVSVARDERTRHSLRNSIARFGGDDLTRRLLASVTFPDQEGFSWVANSAAPFETRAKLALDLVSSTSDSKLASVLHSPVLAANVSQLVEACADAGAGAVLKISQLPSLPLKSLASLFDASLELLSLPERRQISWMLLKRVVREDEAQQGRVAEEMIARTSPWLSDSEIFSMVLSRNLDGFRVSRMLVALASLPSGSRITPSSGIDLVAHHVAARKNLDLSPAGAHALAIMLQRSSAVVPKEFFRACRELLPAAFSATGRPVSSIVVIAFPPVHEALRAPDDGFAFSKLFSFSDWNKCKSARRDLVKAFMRSVWPPEDLLKIAWNIREVERVINRVLKEPGGKAYCRRIEAALRDQPSKENAKFLERVSALQKREKYIADAET